MHWCWECKNGTDAVKTIWWFLKKLNIKLPDYPAIPLVGIHSNELKAMTQTDTCTPVFIAALFTIAKGRNKPTSINRRTDK